MKFRKTANTEEYGENLDWAVSNSVGVILLVSVVIIAVSIVGVRVYSQPVTQQVPVVSAEISYDASHIYILNNGGDTVSLSTIKIYLDGKRITDFTSSSDNAWHIGSLLTIPFTGSLPGQVGVVYSGTGGPEAILATSYLGTGSATGQGPESSSAGSSYTITASVSGGQGTISPADPVSVGFRRSVTYTMTPASGWAVSSVYVDGTSVGAVNSYTFTNVMDSHTISVSFTPYP
ncbi:MAG: type IV pilin N-terminal domain-containing protein [Methanoregulaceae archaeon]